jgi:hypothetical protein
MRKLLEITHPVGSIDASGRHRVSCAVAGHDIYIESDTPLWFSSEAFACACLLPAMSAGEDLKIHAPVCDQWLDNIASARGVAQRWWAYSGGEINATSVHRSSAGLGAAMFFTGGVDSFYTLLNAPERIEAIVFVEGFDVKLTDSSRLQNVRRWLNAIAEAKDVNLITVRTNMRAHPVFHRISWNISHGSALAAVGHCLSTRFSRLYIASTELRAPPWGSHPELDETWSSRALRFINHAPDVSRLEKVASISRDPLVSRYLRVCWQHLTSDMNCGSCEKCLRTQLALQAVAPEFFGNQRSFPARSLLKSLNRLDHVHPTHHKQWQDAINRLESPELKAAATRLLRDQGAWRHTRRAGRLLRRELANYVKGKLNQVLSRQ